MIRAALVVLVGVVAAGSGRARAEPTRLDGIAAVVGGLAPGPGVDVVLISDVDLMARIQLAGTAGGLPLGPLPPELWSATLQRVVGEHLIAREARRLRLREPGASEVRRERQRLEQSAGGPGRLSELLAALGGNPAEITEAARRRAWVASFLEANLEGGAVITEAEVDRAMQQEPGPLSQLDPEAARELVRARLARQALQKTVERWVQALRARTPLRVIDPSDVFERR